MTNPLNEASPAMKKIADFLDVLSTRGGLKLQSEILACNGQVQPDSSSSAGALPPASSSPAGNPEIKVEFSGPDTPLLLARNGELLLAIEHIAAKILRLEPENHDRISFDAEGFKANRDRELEMMAELAIEKVRTTGRPFAFRP